MNQFLILHKVRGEASFDVAEQAKIGDEDGWILSTTGHRCYPYWFTHVLDLPISTKPMPEDWPDHYQPKQKEEIDMVKILNRLMPKFKRRM
jgi:hypothetical protein